MKLQDNLKRKKLFNPDANDAHSCILNCPTTNLLYLANAKYGWAKKLYRTMRQNFWNMDMVDTTTDLNSYKELTQDERRGYNGILSYLIFLDSLQTNNLGNVSQYIAAPEVTLCLAEANAQEGLHSFSYQSLLETAVPPEVVDDIYYFWRDDKVLKDRCEFIASMYQANVDNPTNETFIRMLIADLLLEGLYFWAGFYFFFSLSSRGLMMGTADTIRLIMRDEMTHIALFKNILKEILNSVSDEDREWILNTMKEMGDKAVEQEINWWKHIIGDNILGFSSESIEQFIGYVAYKNIYKPFGLESKYSEYKNPYKHLDLVAAVEDSSTNRGNFFESSSNSYQQFSSTEEDDDW
jgi:ribonucleoside-diphosphate reductase beta chain